MELKQIISKIRKNVRWLIAFGVVGAGVGILIFYVVPAKYVASGNFYVTSVPEAATTEYFAYDGYYANQAARHYAETVFGMFQSKDILNNSLTNMNFLVTDSLLREKQKLISVKKTAPQLIELRVKGESSVSARALFNEISKTTIETSKTINDQAGDSNLNIVQVRNDPVITLEFSNVVLNIALGFLLGMFTFVFLLSVKVYFEKELL